VEHARHPGLLRIFWKVHWATATLALAVTLATMKPARHWQLVLAGVLWSGCASAVCLGLPMLVVALPAVVHGMIEMLGLVPLVAAVLYARVASRVWAEVYAVDRHRRRAWTTLAGALLGFLLPALTAVGIETRAQDALSQLLAAPTPALRSELRCWQRWFGLESPYVWQLVHAMDEQQARDTWRLLADLGLEARHG